MCPCRPKVEEKGLRKNVAWKGVKAARRVEGFKKGIEHLNMFEALKEDVENPDVLEKIEEAKDEKEERKVKN